MITEKEAMAAMEQLQSGLDTEQLVSLDTFISFAISKCTSEVMKQMNENLSKAAAKHTADSL